MEASAFPMVFSWLIKNRPERLIITLWQFRLGISLSYLGRLPPRGVTNESRSDAAMVSDAQIAATTSAAPPTAAPNVEKPQNPPIYRTVPNQKRSNPARASNPKW